MFELKNEIQKNELLKTLKRINSYFNYKFGKLNINDIESYFDRQLCNYDYDLAIKHCGKHFETDNQLKFFDTIDKVELMNLLNKNLQSQFLYNSTITDFYRFILPYDIANINGINTNTIEVVTLLNTDKILTIYPILPIKNEKYKINSKVKKLKGE